MGDARSGDDDDGPAGSHEAASCDRQVLDDACIAAVLTEALRAEEDVQTREDELLARLCQDDEHSAEAQRRVDAAVTSLLSGLLPGSWSRPPPSEVSVPSDHARLQALLSQHGLEEATVAGDGACQFRALSDQLYRSEKYHAAVRAAVVSQLRGEPHRYEAFISDWPSFDAYCEAMAEPRTWGDHVTLQAAADAYGCRIAVITTYSEASYLEVLPRTPRTQRCLWLALHAEVHYNSIYPRGEVPAVGQARLEQLGHSAA